MADTKTALLVDPAGRSSGPVLVSVFLAGGADGLHLAPPTQDADYRKARPTLAVSEAKALPLDDIFSFHPELSELHAPPRV
jgi:uncharacterized protein (DUF1501 family)